MRVFVPALLGIIAVSSVAADSRIRAVFVKGNEIYRVNADGSDAQQLTSDQVPKSLPHWSRDGKKIAFIEGVDKSLGLAGLRVIDDNGNEKARVLVRPKGDIPIEGMRYVEELKWMGSDRVLIGGSVNQNNAEYTIVQLPNGKEIMSFLCDAFSAKSSPDGQHVACWGEITPSTPDADRFENLTVDGSQVFPLDGEQIHIFSMPVWTEDSKSLAILVQRADHQPQALVWSLGGKITTYPILSKLQLPYPPTWVEGHITGVALFWENGRLYFENGSEILTVDPASGAMSKPVMQQLVRSPSRREAAKRSLSAVVQRLGGREADLWTSGTQ